MTDGEPIECCECGKVFERGETDAHARFDFCSLACELKYAAAHPEWRRDD